MDWLLFTGATGFIGHYVLAELLERGQRCAVLLREPVKHSKKRLAGLLTERGIDLDAEIAAERLIIVPGDLCDGFSWPDVPIGGVVHIAAATRFTADASGEPWKTNVEGTEKLLKCAADAGVGGFHLVSSAYACGTDRGLVGETFVADRRDFHNDYERSKWAAEARCVRWAGQSPDSRRLTIYRPSIVVGEYQSGRSIRFNGFYVAARATELLSRSMTDADPQARHSISLRINGRPAERQNIVPVDYVATIISSIIACPERHGQVYHLVHPDAPTNQQIKRAMELHFDIGGGRFVDPDHFARQTSQLNDHERMFYDVSRPIEHYFIDTPDFARGNTRQVEREFGIECPRYDAAAIARLVRYAQKAGWGRKRDQTPDAMPMCAAYFEKFLPRHVGRSRVARMTGLSATVKFVIEDEDNGQWLCRFDDGQLTHVRRDGASSGGEDFAYRSDRVSFWKAISGRVHPQELFLNGRADITGNMEQALKMAMALHAFTQEFPCDFESLMRQEQQEQESCPVP